MSAEQLRTACGVDAGKWTDAFVQRAHQLMDGSTSAESLIFDFGWQRGWFANAMMAMHNDVHRRYNEGLG